MCNNDSLFVCVFKQLKKELTEVSTKQKLIETHYTVQNFLKYEKGFYKYRNRADRLKIEAKKHENMVRLCEERTRVALNVVNEIKQLHADNGEDSWVRQIEGLAMAAQERFCKDRKELREKAQKMSQLVEGTKSDAGQTILGDDDEDEGQLAPLLFEEDFPWINLMHRRFDPRVCIVH